MVRKILKPLLVMLVALLAVCALAMPAFAWDKDYACGYTLIPEDSSLFEGTEFYGRYLDDDPAVSADEEEAILDDAWMASGFVGSRDISNGPLELWLAVDNTNGAQRINLSAAQNAELANAQVTLKHYAGAEADGFVPANCALIAYNKQTGASARVAVTYTTGNGILNGVPTTFYYANISGKLKDVLGIYTQVLVAPFNQPITERDIDDNTATYWHATINDSELATVHIIGQEKTDAFYSPINRRSVDGSIAPYFDEELGMKFYVELEDACTIDEVSYTVGGTKTVLQPLDETDPYWDEYPVYQVPPTSAPVTITVTAHELQHWVNADGTVTFEDNYLPKASKISFSLPTGVTFRGVPEGVGGSEIRSPFEVANAASVTTGGVDYYCFPDKSSLFSFSIPDGYVLEGAALSPASAGTVTRVNSRLGRVQVKLNAPATLTLTIGTLNYNHVDTNQATGVSVNLNSIDAQRVEGAIFCVDKVSTASELEKIKSAIRDYVEEEGKNFSPNEIVAYDIAYKENASDPYYYPLSGWCTYTNYVTIPLPSGWDAATTRVFRYYSMFGGWNGVVDLAATTTVVNNGKALKITLSPESALGRFVLAREGGSSVHAPGWANENGGWYYYENDGSLRKNAWIQAGGSYYYLGSDGKLVISGWVQYGGAYYYMGANGKPVVNNWVQSGGTWYYMNASGKLVTNNWVQSGGKYYYMDWSGKAVTNNWVKYAGYYFYMDANGNPVVNNWVEYQGTWYHFNGSGVCDRTWKAS